MDKLSSDADEFAETLKAHASLYAVELDEQMTLGLRAYYEQVMAWNARLHLVAPCSPTEFATRHVLESLLAIPHLAREARVTDVGSGAGLPLIPCLIARHDLQATLIEASPKKAVFLREALKQARADGASRVINERFEKTVAPEADYVTCRALDRFAEMFSRLVEWSPPASTLLLFGGQSLRAQIEQASLNYKTAHVPQSERRFLFIVEVSKGVGKEQTS